jgi:lincosamide and streptogramin A transport system ATP-binding/permease protein
MSLINISNLTFAYDGSYDNVFENVSFQFDTDWKLGFTGRNGRGKTTFLQLLLGNYEYSGAISASVSFEYFPFAAPNATDNTLAVIESVHPAILHWQILRELSLLQVTEDVLYRPFATLSPGEQTKVLLATLFLKENRFLLIDEPTNHLDRDARQIVSNYLNGKRGYILVSHDRAFLDNCIDHILSINKTNIEIQRGNFSSWWANKKMQDEFELAENEKLRKDIARLTVAARRTADWSDKVEQTKWGVKISGIKPDKGYLGRKAAKMMQRAKNIETRQQTALESKSRLLKNIESNDKLKMSPVSHHANCLLELKDLSLFYGDKKICTNVSFLIEQSDRIALCGKNGSGKTSLLKLICGNLIAYTGALHKASQLKISYVSQDTSRLRGSLSDFAASSEIDETIFKTCLRQLDFSRVQFEKDMADFSAGQKKKVLLAKSLCEKAHLFIWDEPLNYIDVISRLQIEELLLAYSPTMLFVEHDQEFCKNIATKIVAL